VVTLKVASSVSNSSTAPWMCSTSNRCHVGHCDGVFSQKGPEFHKMEVRSWSYDMPLVRRSAGLLGDGQCLQCG